MRRAGLFDDQPIAQDPIDGDFGNDVVVDDFGAFDDEFK